MRVAAKRRGLERILPCVSLQGKPHLRGFSLFCSIWSKIHPFLRFLHGKGSRRLRTAGREDAFGGVAPRPHDLFEKRSIKNFLPILLVVQFSFCLLFIFQKNAFLHGKRKCTITQNNGKIDNKHLPILLVVQFSFYLLFIFQKNAFFTRQEKMYDPKKQR